MDKLKVLRQRSVDEKAEKAKRRKILFASLTKLIKKDEESLTKEDIELLEEHDEIVQDIRARQNKGEEKKDRMKEWEEDLDILKKKCSKLAEAIRRSKRLVVYTGAGISTSANIPDYRGPNGVWTLLDQGKEVAACDLGLAQPTPAHMALFMLHQQGKISHIVSQNCDGLHLRSGMPRNKLSEVHGNMFIEVCKTCKPVRPYVRLFDVTERTNRYRHSTMRRCYICGSALMDTIVHFGERGSIAWPINWNGASKAAEKADMILCLGSSLKVLRRYPWLWCMDRPVKQRPPLYIVNLQWTPKDAAATLKLNGRCDFIMSEVLKNLGMRIPEYTPYNDPLLSYATHLNEREEHTTTRRTLIESKPVGVNHISMEARITENGVIKEVRVENKFTWVGNQFQSRSRSSSSSESSGSTRESSRSNRGESSAESSESSRSSRGSKSSSNQSSNSSSSTTSRNSSSSRASDSDEDMAKADQSASPDDSSLTAENIPTDRLVTLNQEPSPEEAASKPASLQQLSSSDVENPGYNSSTGNLVNCSSPGNKPFPAQLVNSPRCNKSALSENGLTSATFNGLPAGIKSPPMVNGTNGTLAVDNSDEEEIVIINNGFHAKPATIGSSKISTNEVITIDDSSDSDNESTKAPAVTSNSQTAQHNGILPHSESQDDDDIVMLSESIVKTNHVTISLPDGSCKPLANHLNESLRGCRSVAGQEKGGAQPSENPLSESHPVTAGSLPVGMKSCGSPSGKQAASSDSAPKCVPGSEQQAASRSGSCKVSIMESELTLCQQTNGSNSSSLIEICSRTQQSVTELNSANRLTLMESNSIVNCKPTESNSGGTTDTATPITNSSSLLMMQNEMTSLTKFPLKSPGLEAPGTSANLTKSGTEMSTSPLCRVPTMPVAVDASLTVNCEKFDSKMTPVKTEASNYGCDIKIQVSPERRFDPGFHSPPYQDHTYASPPHKQQRRYVSPVPGQQTSPMSWSQASPSARQASPMKWTEISTSPLSKSTGPPTSIKPEGMHEVKTESGEGLKPHPDSSLKAEIKEESVQPKSAYVVNSEMRIEKTDFESHAAMNGNNREGGGEVLQVNGNMQGSSSVKSENEEECEIVAELEVKHDILEIVDKKELKEDSENASPGPETSESCGSRRYGLRKNRGLKYHGFKEEVLFNEQLMKAVKEEAKKDGERNGKTSTKNGRPEKGLVNGVRKKNGDCSRGGKEKNGLKIRDIEYRTIEWARDALYFSYEPNFLFLEDETGYVCECCDPKTRRRGGGSSEENSEAELNDMQEEDGSATEECEGVVYQAERIIKFQETEQMSIVNSPGWFGKGRRKRGKTK